MKTILKPSIVIGGTEFACKGRTTDLTPGDFINYCEQEWGAEFELELTYGADGSWNALYAMQDTYQTVTIRPSQADAVSVDNPEATFTAAIPAIPFMSGAERGARQTFTLSLTAEAAPIITTVAA